MAKSEIDSKYISDFVKYELKRTQPLRDRFDSDFKNCWIPDGFTIDQNKGDYKLVTSNRPRVWADKLVSELTYANIDLKIPIEAKVAAALRKACSMTERASYGLLAMADNELTAKICPSLQATLAWQIPVRGWAAVRVWLYEEEDELHVDIAPWDILNTYWCTDHKGISEVVYVRYATKKEADDAYGVDSKEDAQGRVEIHDYWNREEEKVSINGLDNGIVHQQENTCKYVPVGIFPAGSIPNIQGLSYTDTIKHQGESCFARVRHIGKLLSEVQTYYATAVALGTHPPILNKYDSSKGAQPAEFDGNPYATGASINLDIGKGQNLEPMFKPTAPPDALSLYQMVLADFSIATGPDVMYGQSPGQLTAQGTAMLLRAAAASMKDSVKTMERAYGWIANEVIKQYKQGEYEDMDLQGLDGKLLPFTVKIRRDDLVTDRSLIAAVNVDAPQDKLTLSGILGQYFKDGIISKQTYRDKTGEVPDTDAEQEIIDREQAEQLAEVKMFRLLKELIDEKDFTGANAVWLKIQQTMASLQPQQPGIPGNGGSPPMPGVPRGMAPRTMNTPPPNPPVPMGGNLP